uniref:C-Jun-amino-terminal kinase-interacting protein 1-like n=1 Tax=Pundamilia nyererei TaxID=303518 RepID=A0A3B4FKM4_9CICH
HSTQRRPAPKPPTANVSNRSNRMSLSSDTEGPPSGPLHPSLTYRTNPDISEEEGEGVPTPCLNLQNDLTCCPTGNSKTDCTTETGVDPKKEKDDNIMASVANQTVPIRETLTGLNYDSVKYTLVVDEHAQLELVNLKYCLNGYNEHKDDSDAETVYQSANEDEDPQYVEEKKKNEEAKKKAVYRFVPRHADELDLEADDPILMLNQSKDLWCQGYNMRTGAIGIFPAFYAVRVPKEIEQGHVFFFLLAVQKDGWIEKFLVQYLGSVPVPIYTGKDVLCAAMQKVAYNRRSAGQPPSACALEVSVKGVKMSVQDQCHSGDQCFHFFQLKNISFCGCHPKYSRYFGFITKHPDQQRFACHVLMSQTTLHPLAESVGRAFQQYYKEHVGYSCPTEDIFIE